ncbi:MAG: hypothetical protein DRR19_07910 [Candidatus Parabeggiatoa sp. nov. 1]|nr:MAG: hypothetical protein DRR19_07910 [Gammaproteobacteria bacterium]
MANRKNTRKIPASPSKTQKPTTTTTTLADTLQTLIIQLNELHEEAQKSLTTTDADKEWLTSIELPDKPDFFTLCKDAYETAAIFRYQIEYAKLVEQEARSYSDGLKSEKAILDQEQQHIIDNRTVFDEQRRTLQTEFADFKQYVAEQKTVLAEQEKIFQDKWAKLNQREQDLLEKEQILKKQELDAEAGFLKLHNMSIKELDAQAANFREEMAQHRAKIVQERSDWLEQQHQEQQTLNVKLKEIWTEHEEQSKKAQIKAQAHLAAEKENIAQEQQHLESEQQSLRKNIKAIVVDKELFEEDKQDFDQRVAQKAAREIENLIFQMSDLKARLEEARSERDDLAAILRERETADLRFGHKTPEEVLHELQALRKQRDSLNKQLAARPSHQTLEKLRQLETDKEAYELQKDAELAEIASLKSQLRRSSIGVIELETLKDQKTALESSRELTKAALDELQKNVTEILDRDKAQSPFPQCSQMDNDESLQYTPALVDEIPDLVQFTQALQQRIAYDPETTKELYYELSDIQCLLGGLAMSHLHLLQGISGIGKTSLPLAFARAIGAGSTLVEVQAGWRDRQDLMGYYNTFEKRFDETEFLQALYRAQCPQYADRFYIIVLDEMNLSHPEQYFADLLSALEQDEKRRELKLMSASTNAAPKLLKEGRILKIPANVWFIGTANHDETTKDFADKTYDRAHVMELPHQYQTFDYEKRTEPSPVISVAALTNAFAKAQKQYAKEAEQVSTFFQQKPLKSLLNHFNIGWGNRLQRQITSYVPVVIAAGGSIGAATDHLLTTKLLRKLKGRYSNEERYLKSLQEYLESVWDNLDSNNLPIKSLEILEAELQRFGVDEQ